MAEKLDAPEKMNVLLVDDQPEGLLALEAILESLAQNLVKARSGREALRHVLAEDFAVILLDVQMPEMDGYETATLIRERPRCRHTPIIFLTASHKADTQMIRGYAVGAVDYIFKPLDAEILRSKVSVFVELARKTELVKNQADRLRQGEQEARELAEARAGLLADLEKKHLELERARARAEQESRFKSKFLAGMSHELRTPLNAIIGFSELLGDEIAGPLAARQKEYVQNVLTSGRHLLALINDILDLSKIEAGRMELRREWVSFGAVADDVHGIVRPLADKRGVQLEMDVARDLPSLYVDPVRLRQVLYNLVSNGIKFTRKGGRVRLAARADGERAEIVVEDSGAGIRPEDLPRLFHEFEQIEPASPASGDKPEGTGLGLALSRRLVEMHGGSVSARSELGKGSVFTVVLPVLSIPAGGPLRPSDAGPPESLVLVVEDDPKAADLIAGHLRGAGLAVAFASNADEAVREAGRLRPAAITLDILMPGIDGWAVLDRLRGAPETRAIPVVVISVVDEPSRGLVLGATDYLVKPVSRESLLASLEGVGVPVQRVTGRRVLLVGRGNGELDQVADHLRNAGCEVERAGTPAGALPPGPVDVVLVDLWSDPDEADLALEALAAAAVPVIGLVDTEHRGAAAREPRLEALARGEALRPDRLVRAVRQAIDRGRRAGPVAPADAELLDHLRGVVARAEREGGRAALIAVRLLRADGRPDARWPELVRPGFRPQDFVGSDGDDLAVLVAQGLAEEAATPLAARFADLVRAAAGAEVGPAQVVWYPADGRSAEELWERAVAQARGE